VKMFAAAVLPVTCSAVSEEQTSCSVTSRMDNRPTREVQSVPTDTEVLAAKYQVGRPTREIGGATIWLP
jgi:hypothetical protein